MSFLTRWDDDTSRPSFGSALRDAAVRAVLPGVGVFAVIVAIGLFIMGPLRDFEAENAVSRWFQDRRTPLGESITKVMSMIGNTEYVIAVAVLVALVVLWRTRQWWFAVVPLVAISLQALVFFFTTLLIDRERPDVEKLDDSPPTSSFPSGHTGAATGLYFTLALMALRIRQPALRAVVVTVCLLVPCCVGSARLYRGMHHVSDVLVALVNGIIAGLLAWNWLRRDPGRDEAAKQE